MMAGELAQYTAVCVDERVLLISGKPGSGKTSLALSLIDRGAILVGDDSVLLSREGDQLIAAPPPTTRGMVEIRNVGIIEMPCMTGPVALLLQIDASAPRFIESAGNREIAGITIPTIAFALGGICDALRVEYALRLYGLTV